MSNDIDELQDKCSALENELSNLRTVVKAICEQITVPCPMQHQEDRWWNDTTCDWCGVIVLGIESIEKKRKAVNHLN